MTKPPIIRERPRVNLFFYYSKEVSNKQVEALKGEEGDTKQRAYKMERQPESSK